MQDENEKCSQIRSEKERCDVIRISCLTATELLRKGESMLMGEGGWQPKTRSVKTSVKLFWPSEGQMSSMQSFSIALAEQQKHTAANRCFLLVWEWAA